MTLYFEHADNELQNFAGLLHDKAGKSIFATLLHAFKYCRAFAERLDEEEETGHRNMVSQTYYDNTCLILAAGHLLL